MGNEYSEIMYPHFAQREVLDLVWTRTPVDGRHEALPNTLNQLSFRKRLLFLLGLNGGDDLTIKHEQTNRAKSSMTK